MRQPSIRGRPWPAAIGGGLVAVSVVAAGCVAALTAGSGHATSSAHASAPSATASHSAAGAAIPAGASAASLTGSSYPAMLNLPVSAARASHPGVKGPEGGTGGDSAGDPPSAPAQASAAGASVPRLVVPDVIAAVPGGVTAADLARLRKLSQVRAVLPVAGARITVNSRQLTVLGASQAALRQWMPPATAVSQPVWSGFAAGDLIPTAAAARSLRLVSGSQYPVTAAVSTRITVGARALLGIAGVDAIVNQARARQLGLVANVAVLVSAPAADMNTLAKRVKAALGVRSQVIRLVPVQVSTSLPVDRNPPKGRPASYMALFQESAAQYCPGLSWTVLAAIGQIESGDGTNVGPSSAGALGPMQFLPATWRAWGIDGFGDTGPPDIMNPFDAVPSAARLLCADGAAAGGQSLWNAIFDYNHALWYADEVLTLADEYAREFG